MTHLRLHRQPLLVLRLFAEELWGGLLAHGTWLLRRRLFVFGAIPLVAAHVLLALVVRQALFVELHRLLMYVVWWVGLGVLSSIGLGTGMHTGELLWGKGGSLFVSHPTRLSGLLFLFPHILQVCLAAAACGHLDFPTTLDVWFETGPAAFACAWDLPAGTVAALPSLSGQALKAMPAAMLWGLGTAIGEIPPYWVSRTAARAGRVVAEFEEMRAADTKGHSMVNRMRDWMVSFLERYGFWGVVAMSAWPNAFFDACGLACGHFGMSFWTFFGATLLGKGLIKIVGQVFFFCMLFSGSDAHIEGLVGLVERIIPDSLEPCRRLLGGADCHTRLHKTLLEVRASFHRSLNSGAAGAAAGGGGSWLGAAWGWVIMLFIGYFAVGVIEGFAQSRYDEIKSKDL